MNVGDDIALVWNETLIPGKIFDSTEWAICFKYEQNSIWLKRSWLNWVGDKVYRPGLPKKEIYKIEAMVKQVKESGHVQPIER